MNADRKKKYCPKCNRASALQYLDDIIDGENTFITRCFCWDCDYAEKNYRKRTCNLTPKLPQHTRKLAVRALIGDSSTLIREVGVCSYLKTFSFNSAFGDLIGYSAMEKRKPELLIPVMNTWNAVVGSLKISRNGYRWPNKKTAMAAVLSNDYFPNYLFIVDNPVTALAVKYAAARDNWKHTVGVVVIKPGQTPPLEVLQTSLDIFAFSSNERQIEYLKKELPESAKLIYSDLPTCLNLSSHELRYYMVNSLTLDQRRKRDINTKRAVRRRMLKAGLAAD